MLYCLNLNEFSFFVKTSAWLFGRMKLCFFVHIVLNMLLLCILFAHLTAKFGRMSLPYASSVDREI